MNEYELDIIKEYELAGCEIKDELFRIDDLVSMISPKLYRSWSDNDVEKEKIDNLIVLAYATCKDIAKDIPCLEDICDIVTTKNSEIIDEYVGQACIIHNIYDNFEDVAMEVKERLICYGVIDDVEGYIIHYLQINNIATYVAKDDGYVELYDFDISGIDKDIKIVMNDCQTILFSNMLKHDRLGYCNYINYYYGGWALKSDNPKLLRLGDGNVRG